MFFIFISTLYLKSCWFIYGYKLLQYFKYKEKKNSLFWKSKFLSLKDIFFK